MKEVLKRGVLSFVALCTVAGIMSTAVVSAQSNANAGSGNGFRVSPVRSEIVIEKGKSSNVTVTIENPTDFQTVAKPIVNDFIASDKENGEPRLILDDNAELPKNDFKKLVQPINEITLAPKEKKDITVRLTVPEGANSGGYYGAIRFVPSVINNSGNVSLTASVGTIVLVTVPGNLKQQLSMLQLGASQNGKFKSFLTSGDVTVSTRLKNSGDIHVQPFGRVQVKDMFGKVVKEYEINSAKANVLPGSIRRYDDAIGKPKGGWIGRYTITANIGYSQGSGDLISSKAVFWYLPAWSLFVLGILVLLLAGGLYMGFRKLQGKSSHRA